MKDYSPVTSRRPGTRDHTITPTSAAILAAVSLALGACGGGGGGGDDGATTPPVSSQPPAPNPPPAPDPTPTPDPAPVPTPPPPTPDPDPLPEIGFEKVSEEAWDETAVRKVLDVFAYGGQATDAQIRLWADMTPVLAIRQMLTFDEHNLRLSPPAVGDSDALANRGGTLAELGAFWSSDNAGNGVPADQRYKYDVDEHGAALENIWVRAAISRGLNPFRARIGFWETNYHMAVNRDSVELPPMLAYYDAITEALEDDFSYADVLTAAATSAAVAVQYGHLRNRYANGECACNEDFAREYHQLFFGIMGDYDSARHETVTIKNTASALTDMPVHRDAEGRLEPTVSFGTERHYDGPLEILDTVVNGPTALDRFRGLAEDAIRHPESLNNLPVAIVKGLADDNLSGDALAQIRDAWAALPVKNIRDFLHAYAISTLFHSENRVKYFASIDRHLLLVNKIQQSNLEGYLNLYDLAAYRREGVRPFRPTHNVFGHQTGLEAAESAQVFRNHYNTLTDDFWRYRRSEFTEDGTTWTQDWAAVIPDDGAGNHVVEQVAEWLWQRFVSDGLKNFQELERAHVYALLATHDDFGQLAYPDEPDRVILSADLRSDPALIALVDDLATRTLPIDSTTPSERANANLRVGQAINFIAATPFVFAQEGR